MKKVIIVMSAMVLAAVLMSEGADKAKRKKKAEVQVSGELGTKTNPVRCESPGGERAYLVRLRDSKGKAPKFSRIGSYGAGPYGNILDGYEVKGATNTVCVFMDMYHKGYVEKKAVPGFTIKKK